MQPLLSFVKDNARWLFAGILLTFLSSFGQTFFFAVFAGDIQSAFDLSHGEWGRIYAIGTTLSAGVMIWLGRYADILRIRSLGALSLSALALACVFMALNPWLALLPLVVFCLRITGQGMLSHMGAVAMARWFTATRGRALAIAALGFAFGQAFLPMGAVALKTVMDWRMVWGICACVALAAIPLVLWLLQKERTPSEIAKETSRAGMQDRHWTRADMLRHPLFWLMVPALLGPSAFVTAFFFFQVHFAAIKGMTLLQFAAYLPLYSIVSVTITLLSGMALDRLGTVRLMPWHQVPMVFAFMLFAFGEQSGFIALGFALMAVSAGALATLPAAFWAEFYGTAHLGAIKALAAGVMVLGSAIGPGLVGTLIDRGVALEMQYLLVAVYFAIASGCILIGMKRFGGFAPRAARSPQDISEERK